jgi:hypothetical protein
MASTRLGGVVSRHGRAAALCETEIVGLFIGAPRQPQTFIVWFESRTGARRYPYFDLVRAPSQDQSRERFGHLLRDGQGFRGTFDQFHHKSIDAVRFLEAVNRSDIRVIQRREHLGFSPEAGETVRIDGERFGEDL